MLKKIYKTQEYFISDSKHHYKQGQIWGGWRDDFPILAVFLLGLVLYFAIIPIHPLKWA